MAVQKDLDFEKKWTFQKSCCMERQRQNSYSRPQQHLARVIMTMMIHDKEAHARNENEVPDGNISSFHL